MKPTCLVVACLALASAAGAEPWMRARSPRVEVLTNGSAAQALQAAERLDVFHRVLQSALAPLVLQDAPPPLVLALRDAPSFSRVVPLRNGEPQEVDGVILGGADRTYVAVNLGSEAADLALAHEYAHFALNPILPAQPAWLGEGLAELLAGARVWPESATLGRASDAHLQRIARDGPMPLRALLNVGYLSPTYQGGPARGTGERELFYAQSWALAHWIVAGGHGGMPAVIAYAEAIADGDDPSPAFARCFGMTVEAAEISLAAYVRALPLPTLSIPLPPAPRTAPVQASAVDAAEVDAHLGDLLMRGGRTADAREHFERALRAGSIAAHEGMAALLLRDGRVEEARKHVEAAAAGAPDDARGLQRRADHLVREAAQRGNVLGVAETARAVALLERALASDPDLADAADLLSRLQPAPLAERIALMRRAVGRQPERAELAFTLAGLHVKRNDLAEAARVLRRARERTRDEAHRFLSEHLLARIGAVAAGQAVARGTLEAIECLSGGALAFRVRTPSGLLRLLAESPKSLFLYDGEGDTVERDFTCGPSRLPVTARYATGTPGSGDHQLLSLTFP